MAIKNRLLFCLLTTLIVAGLSGCNKEPAPVSDDTSNPTTPPSMARAQPDVGGVEKQTVQVTGEGKSLGAAIDQALKQAIAQVNGSNININESSFAAGIVVSVGDDVAAISAAGFAEQIEKHTQGAVSGFRLLEHERENGLVVATVEVQVAKYKRAESANRLRIALANPLINADNMIIDNKHFDGQEIAAAIKSQLTDALTKSQRFTVLDRDFDAEVGDELARINSGNIAVEDYARLGQELATDLLLVATLDRFEYPRKEKNLRTSERTLSWHEGGARMSFRLINVATKQLALSDSIDIELPNTEPTTLPRQFDAGKQAEQIQAQLAELSLQRILQRLFPVTVLSREGLEVVLSQGGESIKAGESYRVMQLGKELRDPQTGQSLGRVNKPCCIVTVTRVAAEMAYGTLSEVSVEIAEPLVAGSLELGERVSIHSSASPSATNNEAQAPSKIVTERASAPVDKKSVESVQPAIAPSPTKTDENW